MNNDGSLYYSIDGFDSMAPFFMSLVSSADHWMFLSSNGGVTAGRKNADNALFPYYTDDKIHDSHTNTGPVTLISAALPAGRRIWQPFSHCTVSTADTIIRTLYKSRFGNSIIFEEKNLSLELTFSYTWSFSKRFGIVRTANIKNERTTPVSLQLLDGIRNILPAGADQRTQERLSTLIDGYKHNELHEEAGLGIFALSSIISDRAEPSESLTANAAWSAGFPGATVHIDPRIPRLFPDSVPANVSTEIRGQRGAFFLHGSVTLEKEMQWMIVADVSLTSAAIADLHNDLTTIPQKDLISSVENDVNSDTDSLRRIVASADGIQLSGDERLTGRHFANTLFNVMRGGLFSNGYLIPRDEFARFVHSWNQPVFERYSTCIKELPETMNLPDFQRRVDEAPLSGDALGKDFRRIAMEFLPLFFSRRHGDPSRPWNRFSIDFENSDGTPSLAYQGNWRDIFQNWEALSRSYPLYLEQMVTKFLNATTLDGYNPYRISQDGIDWERYDPDDPWSNIGYWNDHQIVYLYRLMKLLHNHQPSVLPSRLTEENYAFADVPYRIKPFSAILANPRDPIEFDTARESLVEERIAHIGADGKLVHHEGKRLYVTLAEKVLVLVLTKLSNLVPGGGIWLNTQRPEWNDANNALVGWGLSLVTVSYLRIFLVFLADLSTGSREITAISAPVARFYHEIFGILSEYRKKNPTDSPEERYAFVMAMGRIGDRYRKDVYNGTSSEDPEQIAVSDLRAFADVAVEFLERSIRASRRSDSLYHSYNLMQINSDSIEVSRLPLMLEGQVAVLSSGLLSSEESADVVEALYESALYRPDQDSFALYPDKHLPNFLEKNMIQSGTEETTDFLRKIALTTGDRIIEEDGRGMFHFNADIRNASVLEDRSKELSVSVADGARLQDLYESLFAHRFFTGRSGTFFKYEGLGSIYWHMVSKLLLAVAEQYRVDPTPRLAGLFHRIREGIGIHKSAREYGGFPTDPYSHTPSFSGVQQPGMTGQVKEDIISRFIELGVTVERGILRFHPTLLLKREFQGTPSHWEYRSHKGTWERIQLQAPSIAFTYCGTPIVYHLSGHGYGELVFHDGHSKRIPWTDGIELSQELSDDLFYRKGHLEYIKVGIPANLLI